MKCESCETCESERLLLIPMTPEELEEKIRHMEPGEMQQAYSEMLDGCRKEPDAFLWSTAWKISLKNGEMIGDAGFKGKPENGAVEIGYGLDEPYWGKGYMTEAAKALIAWAFHQEGVSFVEAETEPDNTASQKILTKLGFSPCGYGEEGPRFRLAKYSSEI